MYHARVAQQLAHAVLGLALPSEPDDLALGVLGLGRRAGRRAGGGGAYEGSGAAYVLLLSAHPLKVDHAEGVDLQCCW